MNNFFLIQIKIFYGFFKTDKLKMTKLFKNKIKSTKQRS